MKESKNHKIEHEHYVVVYLSKMLLINKWKNDMHVEKKTEEDKIISLLQSSSSSYTETKDRRFVETRLQPPLALKHQVDPGLISFKLLENSREREMRQKLCLNHSLTPFPSFWKGENKKFCETVMCVLKRDAEPQDSLRQTKKLDQKKSVVPNRLHNSSAARECVATEQSWKTQQQL